MNECAPETPAVRRKRRRVTRRVFIHHLSFLGGGVVLLGGACKDKGSEAPAPAKARGKGLTSSHRTFTNNEWAVLVAAVDRLLPRDQDPGALDAEVPEYIDRMLLTPQLEKVRERIVAGLNALDRAAKDRVGKAFAEAGAAERDALLTSFKDAREGSGEAIFYQELLVLTLEGFLGDPSYGGNKDKVGWALVGFDFVGRQAAEPPPGYDGRKHLHVHGGG